MFAPEKVGLEYPCTILFYYSCKPVVGQQPSKSGHWFEDDSL